MDICRQRLLRYMSIACVLVTLVRASRFPLSTDVTKVVDFYSGVQDWLNFSPRVDISWECASDDPLQFAYVTQHDSDMHDFISVASSLDASWTIVNPSLFHSVFRKNKLNYNDFSAADRIWIAIGQMYCRMGDVLVFSNINDARPLLQGGCTTPMIIQAADRFLDGVSEADAPVYTDLIARAATWPHVWWVMKNAYEKTYFEWQQINLPAERTVMLRPVGVSLLPRPSPSENSTATQKTTKVVALRDDDHTASLDNNVLLPWFQKESLLSSVDVLAQYSGPYELADHRAVVHFPYQASATMMYEGLAAGATFVLPTSSFFKKLVLEEKGDAKQSAFCCRELLDKYPDTFSEYMDWYGADVRDCHVYFDSFDELKKIVQGQDGYTEQLFQEKKALGVQAIQRLRAQTLAGYRQLFNDTKKKACEDYGKPDEFSVGMGRPAFRVYDKTE